MRTVAQRLIGILWMIAVLVPGSDALAQCAPGQVRAEYFPNPDLTGQVVERCESAAPLPGIRSGRWTPVASAPQSRLVDRYTYLDQYINARPYQQTVYRPGQFVAGLQYDEWNGETVTVANAGPFAGADVLMTNGQQRGGSTTWLTIRLSRPAKVKMIWRNGTIPSWIAAQGWTERVYGSEPRVSIPGAEGCATCRVYERDLPAGDVTIGQSQYKVPWLLFFEADGSLSSYPTASGQVQPAANQTCPAWVHDQYTTTAPNGQTVKTWHPQIDPVYWCYFRHDHGSNPKLVHPTRMPVFGYSSPAEVHEGFKHLAFTDPSWGALKVGVLIHQGTSGRGRLCERFHTLDKLVTDRATNEILVDTYKQADFGVARISTNAGGAIRPPECPMQYEQGLAAGSLGQRAIPVQSVDPVGYEPWTEDNRSTIWTEPNFAVNTTATVTFCNTPTCDVLLSTLADGVFRFAAHGANRRWTAMPEVGASGTFYTNSRATAIVAQGAAGALKQYIKPGLDVPARTITGTGDDCHERDAWDRGYLCGPDPLAGADAALERSISSPN